MNKGPDDPPSDYEVGFGKPPKHSQFQPGQSGNPKGKPKGLPTLEEVFLREANRVVSIEVGGKAQKMSKLELAIRQLFNLATKGELRATAMVLSLASKSSGPGAEAAGEGAADLLGISLMTNAEALARIIERAKLLETGKEDSNADPSS